MFRFLDDLFQGNNDNQLDTVKKEIYDDMILSQENKIDKECTFLDLRITVKDKEFETTIYDKRKEFEFETIKFSHITSCTPKNNKYNIITGQLIRYAKACDHYTDFIQAATADISTLLTKCELREHELKHQIRKFAKYHQQYYMKYLIKPHQLISDLTSKNNLHNRNNMKQP